MSKFLFKNKNFVVLQDRNGYIIYNKNKIWENGHTHVANIKMCRTIIDLVLNEKMPHTKDLWVYQSILRICSNSQRRYKKLIIEKMDSLYLEKYNNRNDIDMSNEFTIEELEERIADINNYYLATATANGDKDMVSHWNKVLHNYEQNLAYLKSKA